MEKKKDQEARQQRIVYKKFKSGLYPVFWGGREDHAKVGCNRPHNPDRTRNPHPQRPCYVMFRPTHPNQTPHQSGRDGPGRLDIKKKKKKSRT